MGTATALLGGERSEGLARVGQAVPTASLGAAEGVSAAGPGWGCRLHPTAAPAAAGLPSPSPLSASRGCCSRLFPPPPSRCRFHGNRLGCTPVPRCAPGTRCRPWAPPAPTWGSGSPKWLPFGHGQRGTAWGIQKWVLAWHGGGLILRWGKQTPSAPPPHPGVAQAAHPPWSCHPSSRGGGTVLRAADPDVLAPVPTLRGGWARGSGEDGGRGCQPSSIPPQGWYGDGGCRVGRTEPLEWGQGVWQSSCPCTEEACGLSVPLIMQI